MLKFTYDDFLNTEIVQQDVDELNDMLNKMNDIDKNETNNSVWKKNYRKKVCKEEAKCDRCPWHGGMDNSRISRKPKPDKYKTLKKRKSRAQKTKERKNVYGHLPID